MFTLNDHIMFKGPFKKYVTGLEGGRGFKPKSDVTTSKQYRFNNRIRMTLKILITPLHLLFDVGFHLDNKN